MSITLHPVSDLYQGQVREIYGYVDIQYVGGLPLVLTDDVFSKQDNLQEVIRDTENLTPTGVMKSANNRAANGKGNNFLLATHDEDDEIAMVTPVRDGIFQTPMKGATPDITADMLSDGLSYLA